MRRRIDFFKEEHKTHSNKEVFGLCDDDNDLPAHIDEDLGNKESKWIGEVHNDLKRMIAFYPVDHCVEIKRADGKMAERCEGFLLYLENRIIFAELKNRQLFPEVWRKKAEEQILVTMRYFFDNYDKDSYKIKAWICNKQLTNQNYFQQILDFKDKTKAEFGKGYVLCIQKSINL